MWRIDAAGDRALLVRLGDAIDAQLLGRVLALERILKLEARDGVLGTAPAYASLLCRYDPRRITAEELVGLVRQHEPTLQPIALTGGTIEVPTKYDGADMKEVAERTGLTEAQVIDLHARPEYLVYCIGFAPGFTYCGELDTRLVLPRKASPRTKVPAGSVAIAGEQTGIYAVESPGGWHLIGRTDLQLFDPTADPPARFKPGDRLRFVPRP